MSNRKPKAGDTVWFRPGKLVDVSEDATGKTLYRVSRPDGLDEFFGEGCIDRFEPAPWKPKLGEWATITAKDHSAHLPVEIVYLDEEWAIVLVPGGRTFPIKVSELREPML